MNESLDKEIRMDRLISIVVPIYKVEKYLPKCIESILNQTFTDFELILINDGSPDKCGEICDQYALLDSRIKVIHKENGGLSSARNEGIEVAQGSYIGFVDGDDFIAEDMYETLYNNMINYNADISMCGYADVYSDRVIGLNSSDKVYCWDRNKSIFELLRGKLYSVHAYTKLYKRDSFKHIRYPRGKVSEDAFVIIDILETIDKAVYTPKTGYFYNHRAESINTTAYREIDLTRIEAHMRNYKIIEKGYPQFKRLAFDRVLGANGFVAHKMAFSNLSEDNEDVKKVFSTLRRNILKVISSRYFSWKRKLSLLLLVISKKTYCMIIKRVNPTI